MELELVVLNQMLDELKRMKIQLNWKLFHLKNMSL